MPEPSDAELWYGVEHTVHRVLLPHIGDEWARAAAVQLVGLARYASSRTANRVDRNVEELVGVLDALAGNPIVADHRRSSDSPVEVLAAVASVMAAAVGDDGAAGDEVRRTLRPVLMRQLDDELAETGTMIPYFRGQIDD
jgi:hypothetical protein